MSKKILIKEVSRIKTDGTIENLTFNKGVNVIVGPPNTGKTVWLKMLDYLLGDTGSIESALGNDEKLLEKYISINGLIEIQGDIFKLERKLKEPGLKTKIFINNNKFSDKEFSGFILEKLDIPIIHFPKGNPYLERAWPELSWRMLLRHIYRQERFWSDLADKQPEIEQRAVIYQLLGIADKIFPQSLGNIVEKRKELYKLQAKKEQFQEILDNITQSMTSSIDGKITFATEEAIKEKIFLVEEKIQALYKKREIIIQERLKSRDTYDIEEINIAQKRRNILNDIEELNSQKEKAIKRIKEFNLLHNNISDEIKRLKRCKVAGELLSSIRINHCPACIQEIKNINSYSDSCFLCHQPIKLIETTNRIDFEISQLESEVKELTDIITSLNKDLIELRSKEKGLKEEINVLEQKLRPIRQDISAFVESDLALINSDIGRFQEQIINFNRILDNLNTIKDISNKIDELNSEILQLEQETDNLSSDLDLEIICNDLEENMNNYLNCLNSDFSKWTSGRIKISMTNQKITFYIDKKKWDSALGGTLRMYFLFAYHYGLLSLSKSPKYNYPGLFIVDFPPELADVEIKDKENYLIEPFIKLCKRSDEPLQVIVAGRAFEDLEYINKIELINIWK